MNSAKTPLFIILLICLAWSGKAVVQNNDEVSDGKKATHDLAVTIEPYSTMDGPGRTPSGAPAADATYAYESFGYEWIDTSGGTLIPMLDDTYELAVPVGFDFPFHGIDQTTVNVSANGFLSFYAPTNLYFSNTVMPSAVQPNGIIAPFWDDLRPEDTGEVKYLTLGVLPDRSFTITWAGVPHYSGAGDVGAVTFQVTLYETTGDIVFRYEDVLFEDAAFDNGASATIGVENGRGNTAAVYSVNNASLSNGDALRFYPLEAGRAYDIVVESHSWIDATTGQSLSLDDDDGATLPLGFNFPFFGTNYDFVVLSSNGYLTFGDDPTEFTSQFLPQDIPDNPGLPPVNAVIAPLWDDLNPSTVGSVFALSQGIAPDRSVTFSWNGVPHFSSTDTVTFQTTLHENGDVLFSYQDIDFGSSELNNGGNASVGIEDAYGLSASRYSFRIPSLTGQSLRFSPSNVRPVSALGNSTLALLPGGSVAGWGQNGNGQLGNMTTLERHTPAYLVNGSGDPIRDVIAVSNSVTASGLHHSLTLTRDGRVFASGSNNWGQLGDGTLTSRNFAAEATGASGSVAVAVGLIHSLSLRFDGAVLSWGYNGNGELGDGTTTARPNPGLVLESAGGAPLTGIVSIATGVGHNLALRDDGTILSWGDNSDGQLGDGTFSGSTVPVNATACCATQIAAGAYHSIALMTDGTVMAWGRGADGQLGNNSFSTSATPVVVVDGSGTPIQATSIATGAFHSLAIDNNGQLLAWGNNSVGQLGNGSQANVPLAAPVLIEGGLPLDMVAAASGGFLHSVARMTDGSIWVWGANTQGQLGFDPLQIPLLLNATALQLGTDIAVSQNAPALVGSNELFNVDVTVQNNGPIDALGVKLTQVFSPEFLVQAIPEGCDADGQNISCVVGLLQQNNPALLSFQLLSGAIPGTYSSTASVSAQQVDTVPTNDSSNVQTEIGLVGDGCEIDNSVEEARSWPDETGVLCPTGHTIDPAGDIDFIRLYADGRVCDPFDSECLGCSVREGDNPGASQAPDACQDLETTAFDLFIRLDDEFDPPLFFTVLESDGLSPLPHNSPCEEADVGGVCGGDFCLIENCVEITNGYEGYIYIGVEGSGAEGFEPESWDVIAPAYDLTGPADEIYLDPEFVIDIEALDSLGYQVFVRMINTEDDELAIVPYDGIISTNSQLEFDIKLELWITDPTLLTCDGNPNCIYTTGPFFPSGAWDWTDDCCMQVIQMPFPDFDMDGLPSIVDPDDNVNDNDVDTVHNMIDNCPAIPNATQANHDGDTFGDACDDDDDGDGIVDGQDNCPLVPNTGQQDSNQNDIGDACDGTTEIALCSTTPIEVDFAIPLVTQELQSTVTDAIQNLRVQIQARHAWIGDFVMTLTRVGNPAIQIISDRCSMGTDIEVLLDDATTGTLCSENAPAFSGVQQPNQPLAGLIGVPLNGTWQLTVEDTWGANDDGIVDGWCLFARVPDADNDGIPDSQDSPDSDGDGVTDDVDNCTDVMNPGQQDSNGDGIGSICDGDFTGPGGADDCLVNFPDLQAMKEAFFSSPASPDWNPHADFDSSGSINFVDLQILKNQFFGPPGPSATGCN